MLEQPKRSGLPPIVVLALITLTGGAGYLLGDRHGRRLAPPPIQIQAMVRSPEFPRGAAAPPDDTRAAPSAASVVAGLPPTVPDAGPAGPNEATRALALTLQGSLDEAVQAAVTTNDGPALTMVISRLLVWWLNPAKDARPGDNLWVVYALPAGQEPLLLALRYQSQKLGRTKTAIRFLAPGAAFARYYDETGLEIEERLVDSPLDDYDQVTSLLRDGRGHKGVDFKVPVGTAVHSPVEGVVTKRNWKVRANGDCLGLEDHQTHRELLFLHLSAIESDIHVGSLVHKGQVLARTGNTGHTTAPHLHYQLMSPNNRVLDPFAVQETMHRRLPAAVVPELHKALSAFGAELGPEPAPG